MLEAVRGICVAITHSHTHTLCTYYETSLRRPLSINSCQDSAYPSRTSSPTRFFSIHPLFLGPVAGHRRGPWLEERRGPTVHFLCVMALRRWERCSQVSPRWASTRLRLVGW